MREIIEKEIKWCEEHRGMKSEVFEEAFIAGLKQVLFFISEIEKLEAVDNMSDDQIRNAWSDWYDKLDDEFLELRKSDVSQMAFWAGVKAAQQSRALDAANRAAFKGSGSGEGSVPSPRQ